MLHELSLRFFFAAAIALSFAAPAWAQKPGKAAPPSAEEEWPSIEGKWHVLLFHEADKNLLDRPEGKNSVVTISDKQLQWISAEGKPLFTADCTWKQVGSPKWDVDVTPEGEATQERVALPGIATVFDKDILKVSWRRREHLGRGRPNVFAGDKYSAFFLLSRRPLGSPPPGNVNLVGQWQLLTAMDDSLEKIGSGRSSAVVEFGKDSFDWKGRPQDQRGGFAGGYTLDFSTQPTRINFNVTTPPPGKGATPTPLDGFVPGIVEFLDEDTVRLCYAESGWRDSDPKSRQYPQGFYSDGNINLWIFRRPKP